MVRLPTTNQTHANRTLQSNPDPRGTRPTRGNDDEGQAQCPVHPERPHPAQLRLRGVQDEKKSGEDVASVLRVSARKVDRVKERFVENGLEAALNKQVSERPDKRKVDGDLKAHIVALACTTPPEGRASWSLRLLADKAVELRHVESLSHETVRQILKKTSSSHGKATSGSSRRKGMGTS